ncbi:MAG TPA: lytic transglycosylase domain-containing protein [Thermoanaerobaculia bacterium]|nr:lytic transglycosylase domain-containing protein [Thermoanaerobaculia bacterium]
MLSRCSLSIPVSLLALVVALGFAPRVRADLVVLTDGQYFKVQSYEVDGDQARLIFPKAGIMLLPLDRIERVIDDEVVPAPDPLPQMAQQAPSPGLVPLSFDERATVPEGPYGSMIYETARRHQVNPQIVSALIRAESAGNTRAVSRKGARGLMQLMPATGARFGLRKDQLNDPAHNLEAGTTYLKWLMDRFPNDLERVLAAYNAGEGTVDRYQGVPPYRETRDYIRRIFTTLGLVTRVSSGAGGER